MGLTELPGGLLPAVNEAMPFRLVSLLGSCASTPVPVRCACCWRTTSRASCGCLLPAEASS